jgi:hypothetical protein
LLLTPAGLTDYDGISPPAYWNGTAYTLVGESFSPARFSLAPNSAPSSGDTFAGSVVFSNNDSIPGFLNVVNGSGTVLSSVALSPSGPIVFSIGAAGAVSLILTNSNTAGIVAFYYGLQISLTPTADPAPPPPASPACDELGRVTRAYVSAYQRDRIHRSRLVRGEKRCLVANFNGAIPASRSIVSATWRVQQGQAMFMESAKAAARESSVVITAGLGHEAAVKCQVTLDNGEVYNQLFVVTVQDSPWFQGETTPALGPYELMVTV